MSKLAIVAAILPAAAWRCTNPSLLRLQYLNQVRMRSIIPVPTAKRGTTGLIRLSQCPLRTNASGLVARLYRSRRCDAVATSRLPTQI